MTKYYLPGRKFDTLPKNQDANMEIYRDYNERGSISSTNDTETVKKVDSFKVEISGRSYELLHQEVEVEKTSHRKPHSAVKKIWDDHVTSDKAFIEEQESVLEKYVSEDLKGIRTNLFVEPDYANVVETKITELRKTLAALTLRVDKLKDHYESVNDSTAQ